MIDHDKNVGTILKVLVAHFGHHRQHLRHVLDHNGPHMEQLAGWGDDAVPQREEFKLERPNLQNSCYVPLAGHESRGVQVSNEIVADLDMLPMVLFIAGDTQRRRNLLTWL